MKKLFLFAATAALTLASCSNDEVLNSPDKEKTGESIEFRTLMDHKSTSMLRSAITDGDNILSFTLTGMKQSDNGYLFNGFGITRGESSDWDYTPKRFWPVGDAVDFYAYSPSSSINVDYGISGYEAGDSIVYTVPVISETNAQEDFLVARITNQDENSGVVKLNFHHTLSRIMFFAKTSSKNITYTIEKVELLNLNQTGNLDLSDTQIPETGSLTYSTTPLIVWKNHSNMIDYTVDMGESPIYLLNDYASILGKAGAILVLPQETDLLPATGNVGPVGTEFAIKVSYKAFVDDIYYAGSATTPAEKYFAVKDPLNDTQGIPFEMGRQYNFYLGFGDEISGEISFQVGVSDWNNTPNIYIPELSNYFGMISNDLAKIANPAFDPMNNAVVTYDQIQAVTNLTLTGTFDFTGLEYFKKLTSITLSSVTSAIDLDASKNALLTTVSISGSTLGDVNLSNGALTSLTISGNNTFTSLNASNNQLNAIDLGTGTITGSLDLSHNATLTAITLTGANVTGTLDLSDCGIQSNGIVMTSGSIGTLDLSGITCDSVTIYQASFTNLNVSNNTALKVLNISRINVSGMLDATGNTALRYINYGPGSESGAPTSVVKINEFKIVDSKNLYMLRVKENREITTLYVWSSWNNKNDDNDAILNPHSGGKDDLNQYTASGKVTTVTSVP